MDLSAGNRLTERGVKINFQFFLQPTGFFSKTCIEIIIHINSCPVTSCKCLLFDKQGEQVTEGIVRGNKVISIMVLLIVNDYSN